MRRTQMTVLSAAALPGGLALTASLTTGGCRVLADGVAPGGDPAAAVVGLASLVAALIVGWLTLTLLLALIALLPGQIGRWALRLRDRVTPTIVRRWAAIVLGASMTAAALPGTSVAASVRTTHVGAGAVGPGWDPTDTTSTSETTPGLTTAPTDVPSPGWGPTVTSQSSGSPRAVPGWTPRRPPARHRTDPRLLTGNHRHDHGNEIVVRRGDTLWSIAAAHLGQDATDAEIARAWPRWHAANAERIGADPHFLLPGTRLTPPTHHHDPGATPTTKGTR